MIIKIAMSIYAICVFLTLPPFHNNWADFVFKPDYQLRFIESLSDRLKLILFQTCAFQTMTAEIKIFFEL